MVYKCCILSGFIASGSYRSGIADTVGGGLWCNVRTLQFTIIWFTFSNQLFGLHSPINYLVYTLQSIIWFTLSNKLFGLHSQSKFIFLLAGSKETIIVPFNPARWRQEPKALVLSNNLNIYIELRRLGVPLRRGGGGSPSALGLKFVVRHRQ